MRRRAEFRGVLLLVLTVSLADTAHSARQGRASFEASRTDISAWTVERLARAGLDDLAIQSPLAAALRLRLSSAEADAERDLVIAELALLAARTEPELRLSVRAALYLAAADLSLSAAARDAAPFVGGRPSANDLPLALALYNRAVLGALGLVQRTEDRPQLAIASGATFSYSLEFAWESGFSWPLARYEYLDADSLGGRNLPGTAPRFGIGAPVVAAQRELPTTEIAPQGGLFPSYEWFYPLTVVIDFSEGAEGERVAIFRVLDTLRKNDARLAGHRVPLATAYGAQLRFLRASLDAGSGRGGLVRPGRYTDEIGLFLPEPFDPLKIPVILVHGLQANASTWFGLLSVLRNDDELRSRYQFWLFDYPSGLPFTVAGGMLRDSVDEALAWLDPVGSNPHLQDLVLVGHSMGGLMVRLLVTPTESALWDALFTVPPEEMELTSSHEQLLRSLYRLEPLPSAGRAILLATPHRGSRMAGSFFGTLGSWVARLPRNLREISEDVIDSSEAFLTPEASRRLRLPDSIEALSPSDPVLRALAELPVDESIPFHTLLGDRGTGLGANGTDGVVEYSSSHLEGAQSEKTVPFGHNVHHHPVAIGEVRRILLLHWREGQVGEPAAALNRE